MAAWPVAGSEIDADALAQLSQADVVFLGEVHDNPYHHATQALVVKTLAPKAVVFEMLTAQQAEMITPEMLRDQTVLAQSLDWGSSGWPDFSMYYPIFDAAGDARVFGALVSRDMARAAVRSGEVVEIFGQEAAQFGLTVDLPVAQQVEREAMQMLAHCNALPEDMLAGMVLVQRLRDATLARAVVAALAATGGPVAVITGNGHARTDWGAPNLVPQKWHVVALGQFESPPEGPSPFDLWLVTKPVEREDPCAAFN